MLAHIAAIGFRAWLRLASPY